MTRPAAAAGRRKCPARGRTGLRGEVNAGLRMRSRGRHSRGSQDLEGRCSRDRASGTDGGPPGRGLHPSTCRWAGCSILVDAWFSSRVSCCWGMQSVRIGTDPNTPQGLEINDAPGTIVCGSRSVAIRLPCAGSGHAHERRCCDPRFRSPRTLVRRHQEWTLNSVSTGFRIRDHDHAGRSPELPMLAVRVPAA